MAKDARRVALAKIHIAKKQLGLDEDTYREMLVNVGGKDSAGKLSAAGRRKVLAHLATVGFVGKKAAYPGRPEIGCGRGKDGLLRRIEACLAEAGKPWKYAHGMAKHMFKGIERIEWCDTDQLRKIVAALMIDARRNKRYTDDRL
ncbi:MAG: regulatory protein GemA [Deltaproteobacteria bacterium]|nr:regulatory protein GemA [Deltaproteobacteria bacterium]